MPKKRTKTRSKACPSGKIRYRDEVGAMIALASTASRSRDESNYYRCPSCAGFHLTKTGRAKGAHTKAQGRP